MAPLVSIYRTDDVDISRLQCVLIEAISVDCFKSAGAQIVEKNLLSVSLATAVIVCALVAPLPAVAQQAETPEAADFTSVESEADRRSRVEITAEMAEAGWTSPGGEPVTVTRDQTPGATLTGDWALTGHDCPPFCIQPMSPAPGVTTVGELELIEAMKAGDTILVDGRTPEWFAGGTIPGAINVPSRRRSSAWPSLDASPISTGSSTARMPAR